ncbi:hypothetical protein A9Q76_02085 [Arcobacter sp. 31_11_sub10_T18]|nr:hypothetical protein A9Q76_02085 [Arcobacter sp. 31_11_sub10_T18]
MFRSIFFVLLFVSSISANYLKNISILEIDNNNTTFENIKNSNKFQKVTLPLIKHTNKSYFIKFNLDETSFNEEEYIVSFTSFFSNLSLEDKYSLDENIFIGQSIITLNSQNIQETFFLKLENTHGYMNLDIDVTPTKEYISNMVLIKMFQSLAYGIVLASCLTYLIFYFFNGKKSYLYYSLTQLLILGIIIYEINIFPKNNAYIELTLFYLFSLFSNLFVQYFFHTKNEHSFFHVLLKYIIYINTLIFLIAIVFENNTLYNYLPYSSSWIIYLIIAVISLTKGNKAAVFFLLGWFVLVFSFFTTELCLLYFEKEFISTFEILFHLVVPFQSLVLVFALSYKFKLMKKGYINQREIIHHQNKLASMGEMIENISHQWKQPLTQLSYVLMTIKTAFKHNKLSLEYLENKTEEASNQIKFMSNTITDFSDFLSLKKEKESFFIVDEIYRVISLIQDSFTFFSIKIEVNSDKNHLLLNYKGELTHVIFNLLNNSKDAFSKKQVKNPKITINIKKVNSNILIFIEDNAGGVDENIVKEIFQPYFTTKENGLGIGLYMSRKIIEESIFGNLSFKNKDEGAEFCIAVPLNF